MPSLKFHVQSEVFNVRCSTLNACRMLWRIHLSLFSPFFSSEFSCVGLKWKFTQSYSYPYIERKQEGEDRERESEWKWETWMEKPRERRRKRDEEEEEVRSWTDSYLTFYNTWLNSQLVQTRDERLDTEALFFCRSSFPAISLTGEKCLFLFPSLHFTPVSSRSSSF